MDDINSPILRNTSIPNPIVVTHDLYLAMKKAEQAEEDDDEYEYEYDYEYYEYDPENSLGDGEVEGNGGVKKKRVKREEPTVYDFHDFQREMHTFATIMGRQLALYRTLKRRKRFIFLALGIGLLVTLTCAGIIGNNDF